MEFLIFIFIIVLVAFTGAILGGVYAIYASRQDQ